MGGGWSPFEIVAAAIGAVVGTVLTGGILSGVVLGALGGLLLASTIDGIISGRAFTSLTAFLFEPTRAICKLLGITDRNVTQGRMIVCKVFHENQYPDTLVKNCIVREKDGSDLMKYFFDFAKVGTAQFEKYFYTGKRRFIDALPDCTVASSTISTADVARVIAIDVGQPVDIGPVDLGYPDEWTWTQWTYQQQGRFNYASNQALFDNRYYYIDSAVYNINTDKIDVVFSAVDDPTYKINKAINSPDLTSYYMVVYSYKTGNTESRLWVHKTNVDDIQADVLNEDPSKMMKGNIDCLPIACMRSNKVDLKDAADNHDVPESFRNPKRYKQTKKLLKSIGLDIEEITKQYHENGDINNVYDAYFMAGVSPKQTIDDAERDPEGTEFSVEAVAKYMYRAVNKIYEFLPCIQAGQPYFMTFTESPFRGQVCWAGVPATEVTGKKCKAKHYTMELDNTATEHYKIVVQVLDSYLGPRELTDVTYDIDGYPISSTTYTVHEYTAKYIMLEVSSKPITPQKVIDNIPNGTPFFPKRSNSTAYNPSTGSSTARTAENVQFPSTAQLDEPLSEDLPAYFILKTTQYTTSETDAGTGDVTTTTHTVYTYENLAEKPLNQTLDYKAYSSPYKEPKSLILYYQKSKTEYRQVILRNAISVYFTDSVDEGLLEAVGVDDRNFVFPISFQALKALSVYDKTKFLSEGFQLVFFAKESHHLEFYETPEFGTFLQIVGVVITIVVSIFTFGSQTVTVQAAIQSLIQMAAVYVGVTLALQVIAMAIPDSMLKAVLSAAVMVAAIYFGGGFSDFNFSTAVQLAEVPVKAIDIYTKDQMKALQQEAADFQARYQEAQKQVEQASGQLTYGIDTQDVIATQEFARSWDGRVMSREEFYTITLTCPDLYSVCQDQIDRSKTVDLDTIYPLYDM